MTKYTKNRNVFSPVSPHAVPSYTMRYIGIGCIAIVLGFCFWFGVTRILWPALAPDSAEAFAADVTAWSTVMSVQNVPASVLELHTNTPGPSATPQPTRTPYPTLSHTPTIIPQDSISVDNEKNNTEVFDDSESISDNVQNVPIIEYIEIIQYVTVIVTATPEPKTRTPVPSWTPAPTVNLTQEYGLLALSTAKRNNALVNWLAYGSMIAISIFLVLLVIAIIRDTWRRWRESKIVTMEDTLETAESKIRNIPINDSRRELQIIRLHKLGWNKNVIQRKVFGYTGGTAYDVVSAVIDKYEGTTSPPNDEHPLEGIR